MKKRQEILLVDDMPQNIQILGNILAAKGYEITIAMSGKEALNTLKNAKPDLILLDINMPFMDGYETFQEIKKMPSCSDIPIIFVTAKSEQSEKIKGLEMGASDYITKPFDTYELLLRVKLQLELKNQKENLEKKQHKILELLRVLLHDLSNPLSGLKSAFEIAETDPKAFIQFMPHLSSSLQSCFDIIDSVRNMRALEDGKLVLKDSEIKLYETVANSIKLMEQKINDKRLTCINRVPQNITIKLDPTVFMYSVFMNLLSNAIKFSEEGKTIIIKAKVIKNKVKMTVKDEGIGMPESLLENIFDYSKPTSRSGTKGEIGTGYGMPLIKNFMDEFGGKIYIQSREEEPNKGTKVILYLNN